MSWLGLDIGGANLKAADGRGWARSVSFPLWREPSGLEVAIAGLIRGAPTTDHLAATMTGELCDCFRTKAEGVRHILAAVEKAANERTIRLYLVDGRFASVAEAWEQPHLAAASNWHALACFVCRYTEGRAGLLVDIGSTTTDLIPLIDGRPWTTSQTDTDRLTAGELVYTGVGRTPICAVTRTLPWQGQDCPVAAELFATTADAYVFLGELAEQSEFWTADGRPLTKEFARERLARMVCADATTFSNLDAVLAAEKVRELQFNELRRSVSQLISRMPQLPTVLVTSGSGEFLAKRVIAGPAAVRTVSLESLLGGAASSAAAAHSVAVLARETIETRGK